jgi:hypothetical protein
MSVAHVGRSSDQRFGRACLLDQRRSEAGAVDLTRITRVGDSPLSTRGTSAQSGEVIDNGDAQVFTEIEAERKADFGRAIDLRADS